MVEARYIDKEEAIERGILMGWYPVDDSGNPLTDAPFPSKFDAEKWIRENYSARLRPKSTRRHDPFSGPSM